MLSGVLCGNPDNSSTRANKIEAAMARDIMVVVSAFFVLGGDEA
jgi:hypothetical protein